MCWGQITRYMLYGHPSHAMGILNKWVYTTNGPMSIPFCGNKIKVLTKNGDYDNPQDIYWVVQSHIIKIINQQGFWRISSNISWLYIPPPQQKYTNMWYQLISDCIICICIHHIHQISQWISHKLGVAFLLCLNQPLTIHCCECSDYYNHNPATIDD